MKFVIAAHPVTPFEPPTVIERHEGDEADARRVLRQWMNDDDTIVRTAHEHIVVLSITGSEGDSEIFALFKHETPR